MRVLGEKHVDQKSSIIVCAVSLPIIVIVFGGMFSLMFESIGLVITGLVITIGLASFSAYLPLWSYKQQCAAPNNVVTFDDQSGMVVVVRKKTYNSIPIEKIITVKAENVKPVMVGRVIVPYRTTNGSLYIKYSQAGKTKGVRSDAVKDVAGVASIIRDLMRERTRQQTTENQSLSS